MDDIHPSPSTAPALPEGTLPDSTPESRLLGPGDPPVYDIHNPTGTAPILLVCDHASNAVPKSLDDLGLHQDELQRHIGYDIGAAGMTRHLADRMNAPAVLGGYSRLLIDLNRAPGDPQSIPEVSDGTVVPANQNLSEADLMERAEVFHAPYHHAATNMMAHLWRIGPAPALFSIHTFTPSLRAAGPGGDDRYWHCAVLWNRDPRLAVPLMEKLRQSGEAHGLPSPLHVGDNVPYSGKELAYTIDLHGGAAGLPYCAVEIRQDLVETEEGQELWTRVLGDALTEILADKSVHRVEHF